MDDLEKAILFSFDQSGAVDAALKERAVAYCQQAKQAPLVWRFCLERFLSTGYAEVQFWCLQVLKEVLKTQYMQLNGSERTFVKSLVTVCICGGTSADIIANGAATLTDSRGHQGVASRPVFVKNKLAQIVVMLIYLEYPAGWPSVFLDLLGCLARGPDNVDMFCRILSTLDEEVISQDYPRKPEESAAAMRIKDAMREQCISQVAEAWHALIVNYQGTDPNLAAFVLEAAQPFVSWIDIGLVANDRVIPLLFRLLTSSLEPVRLRGAACDFLLAIVSKRMDAGMKLALLQQLQLVEACTRLTEVEDSDFALKVTSLLTGLAAELLECSKKLESSSSISAADAQAAGLTLSEMLDSVLPAVFYFLEHGDEEISSSTFQFLLSYVSRVKRGGQVSSKQGEQFSQLLRVIRAKMRYRDNIMETLLEDNARSLEEEEHMSEYRRDLYTLFRNIAKTAPQVAWAFVQSGLLTTLQNTDATASDVEVAITLVYQLGEGLSEELLKPGGVLAEMVAALLSTPVPHHTHRVVVLVYLETVVRYIRFVQQQAQYIPAVLSVFLDARGLHHAVPSVRSRASYLFMKMVKVLRSQLRVFVPNILQSLQDRLGAITTEVSPKGDGSTSDEWLYVFEAVGLLIALEDIQPEQQQEFLAALLTPICQKISDTISRVTPDDLIGAPSDTAFLLQVIPAIAYLSKGFGEALTTTSRPEIGALFKQTLELVLRVLQKLPKNKLVRAKIISFLHRMVECLGSNIFSTLPAAISQLLVDCDAKDLIDLMQLVNQLLTKFKAAMGPLLESCLESIAAHVFALVPADGPPEGPGTNTEDIREQREVQRSFFVFLQTITGANLSSVFLMPSNSACLSQAMAALLKAASASADMTVRKLCLQVLTKLVQDWCRPAGESEKVPGFKRFVLDRFVPDCCLYSMLAPNFDLRDANTVNVLSEIATAHRAVYECCGDEFLAHMVSVVLPSVHCPPPLAEQYCMHLQRSDVKELKVFLKQLLEQLRPLQNGTMGYR